ncbi:MAG: hypothetical protein AAGB34_01585 [Planctomycetota bacterium]
MPQNTEEIELATREMLSHLASIAKDRSEFADARVDGPRVIFDPADCEHECDYRVEVEDDVIWVGWSTPDRYLSQSVEADLVYTGDDIDDLIDEELADQESWVLGERLAPSEHLRNEEKRFVFRSKTPIQAGQGNDETAAHLLAAILAYDLAIRQLGDMKEEED